MIWELEQIMQNGDEEESYYACLLIQRFSRMKMVEEPLFDLFIRVGYSREEALFLSENPNPVFKEEDVDLCDLNGLRTVGDSAVRRWQNTIVQE